MLIPQIITDYADQQYSNRISAGGLTMPMTLQDDHHELFVDHIRDSFLILTEIPSRRELTSEELTLLELTTHLLSRCLDVKTKITKLHYINLEQESRQ